MQDVGLDRIGQQLEHASTDRRVEVRDHHRRDLGMFLFDHRRDFGRVEPAEHFEFARGFWRGDPGQHALRLFGAQRTVHHRFDLGTRVEADRGAFARMADEIVQHALDLGFADIGDREHRPTQLADLVGLEFLEDGGCLLLADEHHQYRGTFDAGIGPDGRHRGHFASALIMSRTASAARVGLSRVKPRTAPIR